MPLVHKSGGFVVNLYEGEDLFAIARDRCQKFSHFLDNHEKSWQQKSQMVNRSPTITSTFPEELAQYIDDNDDDNGDNAQHIDNNNKGSLPSRFSGKVVIEGGGVFRNLKSPKMFTII